MDLYYDIESYLIGNTPSEFAELSIKLETILDNNPNLVCFESYLSVIQSFIHSLEGDHVLSFLTKQRALEQARKANDVLSVISITGSLAYMLKDHNAMYALEYAEEFYKLGVLSGLPRKIEAARHYMGLIHAVRGVYDMAVECQVAAAEVYNNDKGPPSSRCAIVSIYYSDLEDARQALYWANESFRITGGKGDVQMHYAMLRALHLLHRIDAADYHLNELHKLSLESAADFDQALFLEGRGIHELKSGDPQAAIASLEQALAVVEPLNLHIGINRCLVALTQVEIQLADESSKDDSSGPWMVRLESHAQKRDYPGIQMQAALLRAEFLVKQGRKSEAREVLQDALEILDSPTVKTLRTRIQNMLGDLIVA
ncbi:MAG: tetratricopeptide repeat protein [Candidatus Thorarchaeota archaeon SMTZ1-45]